MTHILLKNLLIQESPRIGGFLDPEAAVQLQRAITNVEINTDRLLGTTKTDELDDDFFFLKGLAGGSWDRWIALFKRLPEGNQLCFASGFKQVNWNIEGLPTYQVRISKRYAAFPKHSAASSYLMWATSFPQGVVLTSDRHQTDEGAGIWQELLTRPDLHADVFVWNLKEKRREAVLDWKDVFGHEDRYADIVVALKTNPQ